jgi:hypothetical protein
MVRRLLWKWRPLGQGALYIQGGTGAPVCPSRGSTPSRQGHRCGSLAVYQDVHNCQGHIPSSPQRPDRPGPGIRQPSLEATTRGAMRLHALSAV